MGVGRGVFEPGGEGDGVQYPRVSAIPLTQRLCRRRDRALVHNKSGWDPLSSRDGGWPSRDHAALDANAADTTRSHTSQALHVHDYSTRSELRVPRIATGKRNSAIHCAGFRLHHDRDKGVDT